MIFPSGLTKSFIYSKLKYIIMIRKFVDREFELSSLNRIYTEPGLRFIIVYGRRRVGKTELIKRFSDQKDSIYFLADKRGTKKNVMRMAKLAASYFHDTEPKVDDFDELFSYISKRADKKNLIIIIDEFSYLVEKDDSIPSVFQLIVDEVITDSNIFLTLSGSSVSMMENLLGKKSPLYGRGMGHFKLDPFRIEDVWRFFPRHKIGDIIRIYSVTGGIAYYCSLFDPDEGVFGNINRVILSRDGRLYEEIEFLLSEEFRDSATYENILEAMSTGLSSLTKIANHADMNAKDASSYLKTLINLRIVRKEKPITERLRKKTNLYFIEDNFFKFWFRFAKPNMSYLESGNTGFVLDKIKRDFDYYVSRQVFESVCKEFISKLNLSNGLPLKIQDLGRWWEKGREIDLVGINDETRQILFIECKWKDKVNPRGVLEELKEKTGYVRWNKNRRRESYCIIAKSFSKKTGDCLLFDLKDLEKHLLPGR